MMIAGKIAAVAHAIKFSTFFSHRLSLIDQIIIVFFLVEHDLLDRVDIQTHA